MSLTTDLIASGQAHQFRNYRQPDFVLVEGEGAWVTDADGKRYHHVPRNDALRKTLKPVYTRHPGWTEDVSHVRSFADLPVNAQRYVASMVKALVEVAFHGEPLPAADKLPNLRYLGVGPEPSQIIKDVPSTADLIKLA